MIRSWFDALPGPLTLRIVLAVVILLVVLVALHFIYTWMGDTFLDTGGGVG